MWNLQHEARETREVGLRVTRRQREKHWRLTLCRMINNEMQEHINICVSVSSSSLLEKPVAFSIMLDWNHNHLTDSSAELISDILSTTEVKYYSEREHCCRHSHRCSALVGCFAFILHLENLDTVLLFHHSKPMSFLLHRLEVGFLFCFLGGNAPAIGWIPEKDLFPNKSSEDMAAVFSNTVFVQIELVVLSNEQNLGHL